MTCARCGLKDAWNGDWCGYLCPHCADEMVSANEERTASRSRQFKLTVPTDNANYYDKKTFKHLMEEYAQTNTPVLIHEAHGVRIVLGTHDAHEFEKPDIQTERRANGWAIILQPFSGGDPSGCVYFLDDGRSYLVKEDVRGLTPELQVVGCIDEIEGLD